MKSKRLPVNPLLTVDKALETDQKRPRRALSEAEVTRLLTTAPPERAIVYRVALAIGLRRAELEDLRWGDVRLNAITPYVQLRASSTKARRADRLSLPATLADELRKRKPADVSDAARVFDWIPDLDAWKCDLDAAGISWKNAMGAKADFHGGTRKTLCTRLHKAGVPLATAMRVMRHTDARLTLVDYVDDEQLASDTITAAIPELIAPAPAAAQAAFGA